MKGSIEIEWRYARYLSKNMLYIRGDKKLGYQSLAKAEMKGIAWMIRPKFYGYTWTDEDIYVTVTVYRPKTTIDAHNWIDGVADALQIGIRKNDSTFMEVTAVAIDDKTNPRVVITVSQGE